MFNRFSEFSLKFIDTLRFAIFGYKSQLLAMSTFRSYSASKTHFPGSYFRKSQRWFSPCFLHVVIGRFFDRNQSERVDVQKNSGKVSAEFFCNGPRRAINRDNDVRTYLRSVSSNAKPLWDPLQFGNQSSGFCTNSTQQFACVSSTTDMKFGFDGILGIGWNSLDGRMSPPLDQVSNPIDFTLLLLTYDPC
jgi:hypothetical protein